MTPFESARRLEWAARAVRQTVAAAAQVAEDLGQELPTELTVTALIDWFETRAADVAVQARVAGVDPSFDPRYRRPWGLDRDAIRADLGTAGLMPCDFWDCVEVATADVRWCRTWSGGSFESTSRYCDRHLAELRARAAWATGDPRVTHIGERPTPADVAAVEQHSLVVPELSPGNEAAAGDQLDLLGQVQGRR